MSSALSMPKFPKGELPNVRFNRPPEVVWAVAMGDATAADQDGNRYPCDDMPDTHRWLLGELVLSWLSDGGHYQAAAEGERALRERWPEFYKQTPNVMATEKGAP